MASITVTRNQYVNTNTQGLITYVPYEAKNSSNLISTRDAIDFEQIRIVPKPDSISELAEYAEYYSREPSRLVIYSDNSITQDQVDIIIGQHATGPMTMEYDTPERAKSAEVPSDNFFMYTRKLDATTMLTEYRYFNKRRDYSRLAWSQSTLEIFPYVCSEKTSVVYIMPSNFVATSPQSGYYTFGNVILRLFTKCMYPGPYKPNIEYNTFINLNEFTNLRSKLIQLFTSMGFQYIYQPSQYTLIGQDNKNMVIFGPMGNLKL